MIALLRYETAILLRSHRWVFPLIAYGALILTGAAGGAPVGPPWLSLADGLDWSAAMLIPVLAFLTRSMLTAEPDASRACVCAATSPVRTQLATLLAALGGGVVLGVVGACFEVLLNPPVTGRSGGLLGNVGAAIAHPVTLAAGLAMTAVCLLVGSAVGRCATRRCCATRPRPCSPPSRRRCSRSPPTSRRPARRCGTPATRTPRTGRAPSRCSAPPCLLAVTWTASVLVAARRENGSGSAV